jgi:hypothetical protein
MASRHANGHRDCYQPTFEPICSRATATSIAHGDKSVATAAAYGDRRAND